MTRRELAAIQRRDRRCQRRVGRQARAALWLLAGCGATAAGHLLLAGTDPVAFPVAALWLCACAALALLRHRGARCGWEMRDVLGAALRSETAKVRRMLAARRPRPAPRPAPRARPRTRSIPRARRSPAGRAR